MDNDSYVVSGRRAWFTDEETPASFFAREILSATSIDIKPGRISNGPISNDPILKPLSLETEDPESDDSGALGGSGALASKKVDTIASKSKQNCVKFHLDSHSHGNQIVISLTWDTLAQAAAALLFLQVMYQLHSMSGRLALLEASLKH